jgi:predicted ATPase/DNA-binding SARP family transcriptional activator
VTDSLQFKVLGTLKVISDGEPIPLRGRRLRSLLASLLVHANEVRAVEDLVGDIWGDGERGSAGALYVYVSQLRKALGCADVLVTADHGYALAVDEASIDSKVFERLAHEAERALEHGRHAEAAALLRKGLALWRGPAFSDLQTLEVAREEAERLNELRLAAYENTFEVELACGRDAELLPELESLVKSHPFRERQWGQLMLALYRAGRQADALEAYRIARRMLLERHGLEPGPALRELQKAILTQSGSLEFKPPRDRADVLPPPKTSFVGRAEELAAVKQLARDARLVTLSGPGGIGKTRLALEAARQAASDYGAVFVVPLATVSDPDLVPGTVARAVEAEEGDDAVEAIAGALAGTRALLILDSFEHLLPATKFLDRLVAAAPDLTVVVTSRARLGLANEREYTVPPLAEPEGVALFTERAKQADPRFEPSEDVMDAIRACCQRLDGLPLAIELAAARTKLMDSAEIAERLTHRLDLLKGGPSDAPERHRSLRAALEWSYELLDDAEKRAFAGLGTFVGGWTLEAAENVLGTGVDAVDVLASLIDKHLIERTERGLGESRFRMLDTVREYAQERLDESADSESLRRRHAEFFVELAERAMPELCGPDQKEWLVRLEADHDNIRAALAWAIDHDPGLGARGVGASARFWLLRGFTTEGRRWCERALRAGLGPITDIRARAAALRGACALSLKQGDYQRAKTYGEQSLRIWREIGDVDAIGAALNSVAIAADETGDVDRARELFDEAIDRLRASDEKSGLALTLANAAVLALRQGDHERAPALFAEGLGLARETGDHGLEAMILRGLATAAVQQGDPEEALTNICASLARAREFGLRDLVAEGLATAAAALALQNRDRRATELLAAADTIWERTGTTPPPLEREVRRATAEQLRARLGAEAFEVAWRAGAHLDPEQASDLVVSLSKTSDTPLSLA